MALQDESSLIWLKRANAFFWYKKMGLQGLNGLFPEEQEFIINYEDWTVNEFMDLVHKKIAENKIEKRAS